MSRFPANLQVVELSVNTSGTANTDVTSTVLATPGATKVYRLWAAELSGVPNNTGKLAGEIKIGVPSLARLASLVGGGDYQSYPGGQIGSSNTAITFVHRSDVATQVLRLMVYYTIEHI